MTGAAAGAASRAAASASVDTQIQGTLNQQMRMPGVTSEIRDGVATLHGKVASQADKDRAGQVAKGVEGVSRVRNQLTVDAASAAGRASGAAAGQASGAATAGRTGTAAGQVTGAAAGQAGGSAATQVASAAGSAAADGRIQTALSQQMRVSGVTSEIRNGVATLHGKVANQAEKDRAGQLANGVQGVSRVQNQITVEGSAAAQASASAGSVTSPALNTSVLTALNGDARFAGKGINVASNGNGVVTLTGTVPTEADKTAAGRIAADTKSVTDVNNRLTVKK